MAIAAVKIRLMPSSPEANLEEIQEKAGRIIESHDGKNPKFEKQAIAFGLNSLSVLFAWPEEKELDTLENKLKQIKNVNSASVEDIRRAVG